MTLINRLISQAKRGALSLEVPENYVRSVAEHIRQTVYPRVSHEEAEALLRSGGVRMAGVPMKVISAVPLHTTTHEVRGDDGR